MRVRPRREEGHPEANNENKSAGRSEKGGGRVTSFPSDLSASCGVNVSTMEFLRHPVRSGQI